MSHNALIGCYGCLKRRLFKAREEVREGAGGRVRSEKTNVAFLIVLIRFGQTQTFETYVLFILIFEIMDFDMLLR